jgi:hypothetical protein
MYDKKSASDFNDEALEKKAEIERRPERWRLSSRSCFGNIQTCLKRFWLLGCGKNDLAVL